MSTRSLRSGIVLLAVGAVALAGCASSAAPQPAATYDPDAEVTISVDGMPAADQPEQLKAFNDRVDKFEAEYPNITIEGSENGWNTSTFAAQLAGGTLPTTVAVPYTEIANIIRNGQAADITDYLDDQSLEVDQLNPALLTIAQDDDGRTYGVPKEAYSMTVFYNRDLYEQAGLDPETPPTTWDEVRENAEKITKATGVAGFSIPTTANHGGWMLTAMSYGMGSTLEDLDGKKVTATVDNDATAEALQLISDMQWKDGTFAKNFLLKYEEVAAEFAAGKVAQFVGMGSSYTFNQFVRVNGMDSDAIGMGVLPQTKDGLGTLGGGAIQIISPKATPNQIAAALKWISFTTFNQYFHEDVAVTGAKAAAAAGNVIGAPSTPIVSDEVYDQYLGWIGDYINIDRDHFQSFFDERDAQPVLPEPKVAAQQIYATLDAAIQSVLTDENADIDAILKDAQSQAESLIASEG
ncbi:extracellular solute-binding protein [Microbacterium sp. NEAU-LLC]|uniref:Extracellular solute-binding protein n=1 Tax=Microbacterium helvum TaxID=2773713 RepID=A0ABR8NN43_9MICO|nr:extracellular solute-binding protein [Microbacterium helvum]MBD3942078.1 extracellular solute-binding protein [Microbacterium helvum]